eukprot:UN12532
MEITLKCGDLIEFKVPKDIVMQSCLIKTMWSGDQTETEIPLPNVSGEVLQKVIKYMQMQHKHKKDINYNIIEWMNSFDKETIAEVILAANYLDIRPLEQLAKDAMDRIKSININEEDERKAELLNRVIEERYNLLKKDANSYSVMKIIDGLLLMFDEKNEDPDWTVAFKDLFVSNMIYLIKKMVMRLNISDLCQYQSVICQYFIDKKIDGNAFVALVQANK